MIIKNIFVIKNITSLIYSYQTILSQILEIDFGIFSTILYNIELFAACIWFPEY